MRIKDMFYVILFIKSNLYHVKGKAIIFRRKTIQALNKLINDFDKEFLHTSVYPQDYKDPIIINKSDLLIKYSQNIEDIIKLINQKEFDIEYALEQNINLPNYPYLLIDKHQQIELSGKSSITIQKQQYDNIINYNIGIDEEDLFNQFKLEAGRMIQIHGQGKYRTIDYVGPHVSSLLTPGQGIKLEQTQDGKLKISLDLPSEPGILYKTEQGKLSTFNFIQNSGLLYITKDGILSANPMKPGLAYSINGEYLKFHIIQNTVTELSTEFESTNINGEIEE